MRIVFKSVLPGLIQCDLLVLLWTLLLTNIFTLARLQFELRAKRPVGLFCLTLRSSPMVKLLVKLADLALNRHNNMSRETCTIFVFGVKKKKTCMRESLRSILACECGMNYILERNSFGIRVIPVSCKQPLIFVSRRRYFSKCGFIKQLIFKSPLLLSLKILRKLQFYPSQVNNFCAFSLNATQRFIWVEKKIGIYRQSLAMKEFLEILKSLLTF